MRLQNDSNPKEQELLLWGFFSFSVLTTIIKSNMTRLPEVGGDKGNWGAILNDYLLESHTADGALRSAALQAAGAITSVNGQTGSSVTVTPATIGAEPAGLSVATKEAMQQAIVTAGTGAPDTSTPGVVYIQTGNN